MHRILILNGPNLNMLGTREPDIYGHDTLEDINALCLEKARELGCKIDFRQSNHEGELIEWVQEADGIFDALIINAAAYTHSSIAIHDALKMLGMPVIEVHLSDPKKREKFRHVSYIEPIASAVIAGEGAQGYTQALEKACELITS